MANLKKPVVLIVFLIIVGLFVIGSMIRIIPAGYVHVKTEFGRATDTILKPGMNFIIPIVNNTIPYNTKFLIYKTTSQDKWSQSKANYVDYPVDTNTKDGQQVNIYYTIRYSVDPEKVAMIANKIGRVEDIMENVIKYESRILFRNVPREFTAEQLYSMNVSDIQTKIEEKLLPVFNEKGVILDSVGIREIIFAEEYVRAIEAKQIEAVRIETEKNKAEQAKYQKEARITQAETQAREQELLRQTINAQLIQKLWIEKWDGKLPTVMGQNSNLIDISGLLSK